MADPDAQPDEVPYFTMSPTQANTFNNQAFARHLRMWEDEGEQRGQERDTFMAKYGWG